MAKFVGIDIRHQHVRVALVRTSYRTIALEAMAEIDRNDVETIGQAIQASALAFVQDCDGIAVAVDGEVSFVHRITVPAAAAKQLAQVLPFELEAQVPIDFDDLVYDFSALPRVSQDQPLTVLTASARKETVRERVMLVWDALGHEPAHVGCGGIPLANLASVMPELEGYGTIAILDLGDQRTETVVMTGGLPIFARTLSIGVAGLPAAAARLAAALRQTFVAAGVASGEPIRAVYLAGGGASAAGAIEYLSAELGLPVHPLPVPDFDSLTPERAELVPRFAKALGLAVSLRGKPRDPELRQGELAYQRGFGFLKEKAPIILGLAVTVLVSFFFSAWAELRSLAAENEILADSLAALTKRALGEETREADRANELVEQVTSASERDPLPAVDPFDVLITLSRAIPTSIVHDIEEFEMQRDHVKVRGIVGATAEAHQIADALKGERCYKDVKITKVNQVVNSTRQKYQLEFDVKCPEETVKKKVSKEEGEEDDKAKDGKESDEDKEAKDEKKKKEEE